MAGGLNAAIEDLNRAMANLAGARSEYEKDLNSKATYEKMKIAIKGVISKDSAEIAAIKANLAGHELSEDERRRLLRELARLEKLLADLEDKLQQVETEIAILDALFPLDRAELLKYAGEVGVAMIEVNQQIALLYH